jgi:CheY-like chemotaxis protein
MEPPVFRGKRILLVDDENHVRHAFRMMLEIDEHEITEATNGTEALELFAKAQFDLVITDFEMPVMKGNEMAVRIKATAPQQPILMITAYERRRDAANPVDAIVNKPVTLRELRMAIASVLPNEVGENQ